MALHVQERLKGLILGRYAVLSEVWNHPLNRGSRLGAVRDYLLWNAVRFTMDARHVVKLPGGIEVILGPKENYGSAVYAHVLSDPNELLFLAHVLRPTDLFADIGANVGLYSVWVAGTTGASVISFEPVPETYRALGQNVRLNDLSERVETRRLAVGDEAGVAFMTSTKGGLDHVVASPETSPGTVRTDVVRIDSALPRCPYAMKIDVEGFEYRALEGARKILQDPALKAVVIELQDWTLTRFGTSEQACRDLLTSYGFGAFHYDPFTRELQPPQGDGLNELFLRPDDEMRHRLSTAPPIPVPQLSQGI